MPVASSHETPVAPDGKPFSILSQKSESGGIDYEFGVRFTSLESAKETVNALIQMGYLYSATIVEDKAHIIRRPKT